MVIIYVYNQAINHLRTHKNMFQKNFISLLHLTAVAILSTLASLSSLAMEKKEHNGRSESFYNKQHILFSEPQYLYNSIAHFSFSNFNDLNF